jgi:hypothetical protein
MEVTVNNYVTQKNVCNHETVIFCIADSTKLTAQLLVLIHNGHKLDIRHKKFMIHAVDILLIFT